MCYCGRKDYETHKHFLSAITTGQLRDLLEKMGHKNAKVGDEGTGLITISSEKPLESHQRDIIEASLPAGAKVIFSLQVEEAVSIPPGLEKWSKFVMKEIKKCSSST